jgi:hypothetical protein
MRMKKRFMILGLIFVIAGCISPKVVTAVPTNISPPNTVIVAPQPTNTNTVSESTSTIAPSPTQTLISGLLVALDNNSCLYADENYRVFAIEFEFIQYFPLDHNLRAFACKFVKPNDPNGAQWWVVTPPIGIYTQMSIVGVSQRSLVDPAINLVCSTCTEFSTYSEWQLLSGQSDDNNVINYKGLKNAVPLLEAGTYSYPGSGDPIRIP